MTLHNTKKMQVALAWGFTASGDADADGVANQFDTDSDGDGVADLVETAQDLDNNGVADFLDNNRTNSTSATGTGGSSGGGPIDPLVFILLAISTVIALAPPNGVGTQNHAWVIRRQ